MRNMEHDGCKLCKYENYSMESKECIGCKQNSIDKYTRMTNADRIHSMSDEELAEFLEKILSGNRDEIGVNCGNSKCEEWKCTECISIWLQSEVEN